VIATSAAIDSDQVADRALRSGARDFLKKPFGVDELMAAIVRAWDPENGGL
jgi:FixJ family two-component response regulator